MLPFARKVVKESGARATLFAAVILELFDDLVEVGIAGAEAAGEPVASALDDLLAVGDYVELTYLAADHGSVDSQFLLDEGHETRDLGLVVSSGGAVDDFDFH